MELPKRKHIRLKGYDYSAHGAYFVTICTEGRRELFPFCVGAAPCGRPHPARQLAEEYLLRLPEKFQHITLSKWVVMPNHVHFLLYMKEMDASGGHTGPPLPRIVGWYKTMTTNGYMRAVRTGILPLFEKKIWQRGYYEHIIRNDRDYQDVWNYIDQNPARWAEDEYFGGTT